MRRYMDICMAQNCLRDLLNDRLCKRYERLQSELAQGADSERQIHIMKSMKEITDQQKELRSKKFWHIPIHPSMDFSNKEFKLPKNLPGSTDE